MDKDDPKTNADSSADFSSDVGSDTSKGQQNTRRVWEDVLFNTFERLAAAPSRLKDPKESLSSAFDWMKGMREDIEDRIKEEVSLRVGKIDWDQLAKKVGDHMAKNYELEIDAKIRWKPKTKQDQDLTEDK